MQKTGNIKKYVAWGSGRFFRVVRNATDLPFAYIVDNDAARWGQVVDGLVIKGPQALLDEDPASMAVVICSCAHLAIKEQLMGLGEFKILVALNDVLYEDIRAYIEECHRIAKPKPPACTDAAIVIQGPLYPELTPRVLRYFAHNCPEARIVLSTWKGSPPELLEDAGPFIDDLVLSDTPPLPGLGNRNYQILSSAAGARLALERGAKTILKTRTDTFLMAKGLMPQLEQLRTLYDTSACRRMGLKGRLAILDMCCNKFLPYSISDVVTYGDAEDVLAYWDCPLDTRDVEWDSTKPLREISQGMFFPETWFARHFARKIGWELKDTLADSFKFFRDLFIVVDTDWLGFFLEKYPYPQRHAGIVEFRNRLTQYFWQGLYFDNPVMWREAELFDVGAINWYQTFQKPCSPEEGYP